MRISRSVETLAPGLGGRGTPREKRLVAFVSHFVGQWDLAAVAHDDSTGRQAMCVMFEPVF